MFFVCVFVCFCFLFCFYRQSLSWSCVNISFHNTVDGKNLELLYRRSYYSGLQQTGIKRPNHLSGLEGIWSFLLPHHFGQYEHILWNSAGSSNCLSIHLFSACAIYYRQTWLLNLENPSSNRRNVDVCMYMLFSGCGGGRWDNDDGMVPAGHRKERPRPPGMWPGLHVSYHVVKNGIVGRWLHCIGLTA